MKNLGTSSTASPHEQRSDCAPEQVKHKGRVAEFDPMMVQAISEEVYRIRLEDGSGVGAVARMIEKDGDGGKMFCGRAAAYNPLTRAYLRVIRKTTGAA